MKGQGLTRGSVSEPVGNQPCMRARLCNGRAWFQGVTSAHRGVLVQAILGSRAACRTLGPKAACYGYVPANPQALLGAKWHACAGPAFSVSLLASALLAHASLACQDECLPECTCMPADWVPGCCQI